MSDQWRRWEMEELPQTHRGRKTAPRSRPPAQRDDATGEAFQHQAELQALREKIEEEARQAGRTAGYQDGHKEGYTKGHAEGHTQGLEEGRQKAREELNSQLADQVEPLKALASTFSAALEDLDETIGRDLVDLALATGHKLAGEAVETSPEQILTLIRSLLHTEPPLVGQQRLWLNPQDHQLVQDALGEELAAADWTLQPDDQISRGGCRVTSASGELDATWESRWEAVKAQIRHRPSHPDQPFGETES